MAHESNDLQLSLWPLVFLPAIRAVLSDSLLMILEVKWPHPWGCRVPLCFHLGIPYLPRHLGKQAGFYQLSILFSLLLCLIFLF